MDTVKDKDWALKSKVWLELKGRPFIGEGRLAMLQAIQNSGSIIDASRKTGIPYRRMRGAIREMETAIGAKLVNAYRGGGNGGGASLTPMAADLVESFEKISRFYEQSSDTRLEEFFSFFLFSNGKIRRSKTKRRSNCMESFDVLLKKSVESHGHLCAGQVIGVRMAMLGCRLLGIDDPKAPEFKKKMIVYVEIDRCATDAIESVTGCRMGKRTLKYKDFGVNAATFVNLKTGDAYRIVSTEESRDLAKKYAPGETDKRKQQLEGYKQMPDEELFDIQKVGVHLPEYDMPGPPKRHAVCSRCGQVVRDGKERKIGDEIMCRPCAGEGYFYPVTSEIETDAV